MNSIILGFVSSKGGSGKTVTSASFGSILSELGKKVLLIDTDGSTNGLSLLFLDEIIAFKHEHLKPKELKGIFEFGLGEKESLVQIQENLFLFPSTYVLKQTDNVSPETFKECLNEVINKNKANFDYILLDAQAGSDIYARISLEVCDYKIIVSEYDPISAEGVERLKYIFSNELSPEKTWILLNKVLPDFVDKLGDYMSVFKFLSPIPWDAEVIKSFARRKININTSTINVYTLAIIKSLKSLGIRKLNESIEAWLKTKEIEIKDPIKKQALEIDLELDTVERSKIDLEYRLRDKSNRSKYFSILTIVSLSVSLLGLILLVFSSKYINILWDSKFTITTIIGIISIIPLIFYTLREYILKSLNKKNTEEEKKILAQIKYYERLLDDLKSKKDKLDFIAYSEFEDIIRNK